VQQVGAVLTLDTEAFLIRCAEREGSNLTFDISLAVRGTAKSLKRYIGGHFGLARGRGKTPAQRRRVEEDRRASAILTTHLGMD
jgi:hypothetical protein